jgi:TPR repeat protein
MRKWDVIGGALAVACVLLVRGASAGPWEDGMIAYNRGDYVPAIRMFRPLAEAGNPKAQSVIGSMYRKGQGVPRNLVHAFMWFSVAAKRGDNEAKAELHEVSKTMTPAEMTQANEMAASCEASEYRNCEY